MTGGNALKKKETIEILDKYMSGSCLACTRLEELMFGEQFWLCYVY